MTTGFSSKPLFFYHAAAEFVVDTGTTIAIPPWRDCHARPSPAVPPVTVAAGACPASSIAVDLAGSGAYCRGDSDTCDVDVVTPPRAKTTDARLLLRPLGLTVIPCSARCVCPCCGRCCCCCCPCDWSATVLLPAGRGVPSVPPMLLCLSMRALTAARAASLGATCAKLPEFAAPPSGSPRSTTLAVPSTVPRASLSLSRYSDLTWLAIVS